MPAGRVEEIILNTNGDQSHCIKTKLINLSQPVLEEDEERTFFSLYLIPNSELESLILSLGEKVQRD